MIIIIFVIIIIIIHTIHYDDDKKLNIGKVYTRSQSKCNHLGKIKTRYWICKNRKCCGKCTIHFDYSTTSATTPTTTSTISSSAAAAVAATTAANTTTINSQSSLSSSSSSSVVVVVIEAIVTSHNVCVFTPDYIEGLIGNTEIISRVALGQSLSIAYQAVKKTLNDEQLKYLSCKFD